MNHRHIILLSTFGLASLIAACGSVDPAPGALTDGEILAIYNQVNGFDIETSALGLERGQDPQVLALAQMVQTDHSAVYARTEALARELGAQMILPSGRDLAARTHDSTLARLRTLEGEAFDRAYLEHEQAFHTDAIEAIQQTLMPAASTKVRGFMAEILPGFQHHLRETKRVRRELGY